MMSLWDALRMNMMISYQELVRTFPNELTLVFKTRIKMFYRPAHLKGRGKRCVEITGI